MSMKKQLILTLALGTATALPLSAQLASPSRSPKRADTLRRELTVLTQEEVVLGTRQPQDLSLTLPAPQLRAVQYRYVDGGLDAPIQLSPLRALAPMQGGFKPSAQRGYLQAKIAAPLGAALGAGYRLLARERDELDLWGRYRVARAAVPLDQAPGTITASEWQWRLGASYLHRFDRPTLELRTELGRYKTNYYARLPYEQLTPPAALLGNVFSLEDATQATQHFRLDARLRTEAEPSELWNYDLRFALDYAATNYLRVLTTNYRADAHDLVPQLRGQLSRRLNSELRLGLDAALDYYRSSYTMPEGQSDFSIGRSVLAAAPYIMYRGLSEDWTWRLHGGLRLSQGSDARGAQLMLFPKVDAELRYGSKFALQLSSDAEHRGLLRSTLLRQEMPYLHPQTYPDLLERISWVKLGAKTLLADRFTTEVWLRQSQHRQAAQWRPTLLINELLPQGTQVQMPLSFSPYYADYHALDLGATLSYRQQGLFAASLSAEHTSYSRQTELLTARPEWRLGALLELQPLARTELRVGYDFRTATRSYDLAGQPTQLKPLHLLYADAAWRISTRFALTAELRSQLLGGATQWYGYRQQVLTAALGFQYLLH